MSHVSLVPAWIRPRALSAAAFLLALAFVFAAVPSAFAKSYSFPRIDIQGRVEPNGTLVVREERTFSFDGDFSFAYWEFDTAGTGGYQVKALSGPEGPYRFSADAEARREPGTYGMTQNGSMLRVTAYFALSDTDAPFTLDYTVVDAAKRWADTSELYWQAISSGWEVGAETARVQVRLPSGITKDEVKAFGHGPLTGDVTVAEDGTVGLAVEDLAPGTFVEARVLFPQAALPQATPRSEARRDEILTEELDAAAEADARRRQARVQVAFARVLGYGLPLAALGLAVWLFRKYGRDYKPSFIGEYFREDPADLHPAVVGVLWRMGGNSDADMAATLMDMANRGLVTMRPSTEEKRGFLGSKTVETYQLELNRAKLAEARPLDRSLAALLFDQIGTGDTLTIDDIKDYAKAHAKTFTSDMSGWKAEVRAEADAQGFFEETGKAAQVGTFAAGAIAAGAAIGLAVWVGAIDIGAVGVAAAIPVFVLAVFMQRRSKAAAELHAKYEALRNYLRDFSRLHEAPPASVVLWNHFLVLAVIFGIAEEVIEAMRVRIPEVVTDPAFATTYWWAYSGSHAGTSPVVALQSGFASATQVANSQMSSTGGGGGFSGGGGGGFGGGGGGAG